jgi:hypothetical protein
MPVTELQSMKVIHIAENGDDENDGSADKPVYSWSRAYKLTQMGSAVFQADITTLRRISAEIEKERKAAEQFGTTLGADPQGGPQPKRS